MCSLLNTNNILANGFSDGVFYMGICTSPDMHAHKHTGIMTHVSLTKIVIYK